MKKEMTTVTQKISVLLVEDTMLARKMACLILTQLNCDVEAVSTSQAALAMLAQKTFDLIVTDVGLPDVDGFFLVREIRKNSFRNQNIPIVMLSAHSDQQTIDNAFKAGATEFLVKPLDKKAGLEILKKHVFTQHG